MMRLGGGGEWWAHPLGIAGVVLTEPEPVVMLDSHTTLSNGSAYSMAGYAVESLLPSIASDSELCGALGLRVACVTGPDMVLTKTSGDSSLRLRGRPGTNWQTELARHERWLRGRDARPLWDEPRLTVREAEDLRQSPWADVHPGMSWIGSSLLRRVALFHTASNAYSTRSWQSDKWVFELDTVRGVPAEHNEFLDALMDTKWGLPLRVVQGHCSCGHRPPEYPRAYLRSCTYDLEHPTDGIRGLQIRFRYGNATYGEDVRSELSTLGADPRWLDKVLPETSPDVIARCSRRSVHQPAMEGAS